MKMDYVEPAAYFTESMLKILNGEKTEKPEDKDDKKSKEDKKAEDKESK